MGVAEVMRTAGVVGASEAYLDSKPNTGFPAGPEGWMRRTGRRGGCDESVGSSKLGLGSVDDSARVLPEMAMDTGGRRLGSERQASRAWCSVGEYSTDGQFLQVPLDDGRVIVDWESVPGVWTARQTDRGAKSVI